MEKCKRVFNNEDYNSGDGMLTSIWGPPMWHSLHCISFNYPVNPNHKQKRDYYNYFLSIGNILPCKYCRDNFKNNIKKVPLTMKTMENRYSLSLWLYELHEEINRMLGKKSNLTYEEVRNRYEMFRARCIDDKKQKKTKKISKLKEKGCVKPLYGVKSKCILKVVPRKKKCTSFSIDEKCKLHR